MLRLLLVVMVLHVFLILGVAHLVNPDYFLARSGLRKGGEMLTDSYRFGFRIVGR